MPNIRFAKPRVPPPEEQERLVASFYRFDALENDLSIGTDRRAFPLLNA
jgi:hypothetical protein